MASANLRALQATTNRFAGKVGFSPIAVDGGMGPLTQAAISKTLAWVADNGLFSSNNVSDAVANAAAPLSRLVGTGVTALTAAGATAIMQSVVGINTVLTAGANELGLGLVSPTAPRPATASGGFAITSPTTLNTTLNPTAASPNAAGAGSVLDKFGRRLGLSSMQTMLFLAMLGGVGFLAVKRMRARA